MRGIWGVRGTVKLGVTDICYSVGKNGRSSNVSPQCVPRLASSERAVSWGSLGFGGYTNSAGEEAPCLVLKW